MAKRKQIMTLILNPVQMYYIDWLHAQGLHGNTPLDVVERLFLDGLRAAIPSHIVARGSELGKTGDDRG